MKDAKKLAALLSLGALLPIAASAITPEQTYLESCRRDPGVPVPVAVVSPRVEAQYVGDEVDVEFTVDATGKTSGFNVKSSVDSTLASAVVDALKQWRFTPAHRDGMPVATKVELPVHIVNEYEVGARYAVK